MYEPHGAGMRLFLHPMRKRAASTEKLFGVRTFYLAISAN